MKKIALILGVVASAFLLAGCASKGAQANNTAPVQTEAAPAHHDLKGERL